MTINIVANIDGSDVTTYTTRVRPSPLLSMVTVQVIPHGSLGNSATATGTSANAQEVEQVRYLASYKVKLIAPKRKSDVAVRQLKNFTGSVIIGLSAKRLVEELNA